jgi:exodeoxyribonuclease V alpha subunit
MATHIDGVDASRAAKRLSESTGSQAQTIHRLLKYDAPNHEFVHNERRPLNCDLLIVDETSMLDLPLAHHLMKAVPPSASLVMVGDVDQLPPVGPGNFLRDLIDSRKLAVSRLTQIFRQEAGSTIVENAHRINAGEFPVFSRTWGDFFLIEEDNPAEVAAKVVELCSVKLPSGFGFDGVNDVQVLSPMYKGDAGATNLNARLQEALNPAGAQIEGLRFRTGDKVMQLRNNYDKMVFNGDIVWARGYGWANIAHHRKVTPDTDFMLASVSKTVCRPCSMAQVRSTPMPVSTVFWASGR